MVWRTRLQGKFLQESFVKCHLFLSKFQKITMEPLNLIFSKYRAALAQF